MKGYWAIPDAARCWGVSERLVNQYCIEGRVEGAERFGRSWAIPEGAPRPSRQAAPPAAKPAPSTPMPLMNTPFAPGTCLQAAGLLPNADERRMALAEYYYFSGQPEKAVQEAQKLTDHPDLCLRVSACLVYAFAGLTTGRIQQSRTVLDQLTAFSLPKGASEQEKNLAAFMGMAASVLLHLPMPQASVSLPMLAPGLRLFALYMQAHSAYLQQNYQGSLAIVETALALQTDLYPIPTVYLHLVATMDLMSLKEIDRARRHLLRAWELARPDDLIEPFSEHHGLLGGMLEAVIKKDWPDDFARIISITYRFSSGWRKIHNPATGHDVADDLTTTEFAAAMLAARGWTNAEIGAHLNVSPSTVKRYISSVLLKLGITQRRELSQFMLK